MPIGASGIFARIRLRPAQLRSVAERRLGDAQYLVRSGQRQRANAAMYLAGFVIECLLKAQLLETHRWLQAARGPDGRSKPERELWFLCYRSHDLGSMLERLPEVAERLAIFEQRNQQRLIQSLKAICGEWTVYARYSPRIADLAEASQFVKRVEELTPCLR